MAGIDLRTPCSSDTSGYSDFRRLRYTRHTLKALYTSVLISVPFHFLAPSRCPALPGMVFLGVPFSIFLTNKIQAWSFKPLNRMPFAADDWKRYLILFLGRLTNMRKEKEIRILASSPDYEEINQLTTKIAMLKNPHLHKSVQEIPQAELKAALVTLEQELQDLLHFQLLPFNQVLIRITAD